MMMVKASRPLPSSSMFPVVAAANIIQRLKANSLDVRTIDPKVKEKLGQWKKAKGNI